MTVSRKRIATILAVLIVGAVAVLLARQVFGGARETSPGVWDRTSLPERLLVCGRSYRHDSLDRIRSAAEIEALLGFPPTVVQPLQVQPCIPGPCDDTADPGPCDTVVFVRVGADAFVDFALQGGP